MQKLLQCKSNSVEVTGPRSDVSQFPNLDERNKRVFTDKQKAVIEMILIKKAGAHTKSGRNIQVLNVPAWQFIT